MAEDKFAGAVSDWVKTSRSSTGLTQMKFAKRVGVDQSNLGQWESGGREPSLRSLIKISIGADRSLAPLLKVLVEVVKEIKKEEKDGIGT